MFLENTPLQWLIAILFAAGLWLAMIAIKEILLRALRNNAQRTAATWYEVTALILARVSRWVLLVGAISAGAELLTLPSALTLWSGVILRIALWVQVGLWGSLLIEQWVQKRVQVELNQNNGTSATALDAFGNLGKILAWALIILLILDSLPGVEMTSLLAGLGIGGLAIGLALQSILGDLFASLAIVLDKPFVLGDFITIGEYAGTVESIGLKSTRLRSLSGEQMIFSNTDLLNSRIRNYKRMSRRRVAFQIGVCYETPYEKLTAIPKLLQEIIDTQSQVTFERAHLQSFGDFSINYEVVYHVESSNYLTFMDVQQAINLEIFRQFAAQGIGMAYPTQTLWLKKAVSEGAS